MGSALVGACYSIGLFMAFDDRWRRLSYDDVMTDPSSPASSAGYSGTPLAKKLNLRDGLHVWFNNVPENVDDEIAEYALDLIIVTGPDDEPDAALIFLKTRADMESKLQQLRNRLTPSGHIWACWPKQASGVPSEIGEQDIRGFALELGYVDTKKCAVDHIWSGLKLVIRKELR